MCLLFTYWYLLNYFHFLFLWTLEVTPFPIFPFRLIEYLFLQLFYHLCSQPFTYQVFPFMHFICFYLLLLPLPVFHRLALSLLFTLVRLVWICLFVVTASCFVSFFHSHLTSNKQTLLAKKNQVLESRCFHKSVKGKAKQSKIKAYANKAEILGLLANGNERPPARRRLQIMSKTELVKVESGGKSGSARIGGGGLSMRQNGNNRKL